MSKFTYKPGDRVVNIKTSHVGTVVRDPDLVLDPLLSGVKYDYYAYSERIDDYHPVVTEYLIPESIYNSRLARALRDD